MCLDLFSSMDGMISPNMWMLPFILMMFYLNNNFFSLNKTSSLLGLNFHTWKTSSNKNIFISQPLLLGSIMLFVVSNNFIGLTPFTFGFTSHLWVNLSLALFFWGLLIFSGWMFSLKKSVAHLLPSGAPMGLSMFLIIIETISIIIRPLTLTVRLMANISAGHIVLALVSNVLVNSSMLMPSTLLTVVMMLYYMFEYFVAIIQGYIFTLLISLYMEEHP
uniref:ATP synthase subunit a n=1 Tax=Succineidae gen. n. sp. z RM-2021 TaxID=2871687 RepID=A0A977XTD7_9EUPU|nr:ATP synthase F0 subunit 6 [Succineidae gen. n. sp. z RM-2021]